MAVNGVNGAFDGTEDNACSPGVHAVYPLE